jgi:hypothetical protein
MPKADAIQKLAEALECSVGFLNGLIEDEKLI